LQWMIHPRSQIDESQTRRASSAER
jgi:hypothetical protein